MEDIFAQCEPQNFECPVCGKVSWNLNSTIPDIEGDWCLKCYMKWVSNNVPRLKKIDRIVTIKED
jgi:hypothetical protein